VQTAQLRWSESICVGRFPFLTQDISCSKVIALPSLAHRVPVKLLRLLNRLSEPTAGSIYLENQDYRQIIQLRQQVTLVAQESAVGHDCPRGISLSPGFAGFAAIADSATTRTGWSKLHIPTEWLGRTEVQLSVGQRQLVAIALVIQPKILLLDEPTSALDAGRASHLLQVLTLATSSQTTILMVNHQLELAELFSTQVLHLQHGRLIQNASNLALDWTMETLIQVSSS